jgi:hypothetical protein
LALLSGFLAVQDDTRRQQLTEKANPAANDPSAPRSREPSRLEPSRNESLAPIRYSEVLAALGIRQAFWNDDFASLGGYRDRP